MSEQETTTTATNMAPQDINAEKAVLGSVLLNKEALVNALEVIVPQDFYRRAHQLIFEAMMALSDDDKEIDTLTLTDYLKNHHQLADVGGTMYLAELAEATPSAAHVQHYAQIVREKATRRRLIAAATEIIANAGGEEADTGELLDSAERSIMDVTDIRNVNGFRQISEVLNTQLTTIEQLSQKGNDIVGLATGYSQFDKMISGLQPDNLVIIAARPAVGKTAFVLNVAQNIGTTTDANIAIFSLEMSAESLVNRMLCAEGNIDATHLRDGELNDDEWSSLIMAINSLRQANIFIDDTAGIKMSEIRAKCRRLAKEQGGLGLIVVDYLQLIEGSNKESRQQEVSDISRQLKKLSKELKVPVIALSQLSRGVEQRQDKRPVLSDIRESGSIEQDADIVAFLYRDDYYEREDGDDDQNNGDNDDSPDVGEVELIVEKNRSGRRGTVKLVFVKSYNKFTNTTGRTEDQ